MLVSKIKIIRKKKNLPEARDADASQVPLWLWSFVVVVIVVVVYGSDEIKCWPSKA